MKLLLINIYLLLQCATAVIAQENFNRDTLFYKQGVYEYNIDFFGLERTLNWDTISKLSSINEVELKFYNNTLTPIEIKKTSKDGQVISWRFPEDKVTIPPGDSYDIRANYSFIEGAFQSRINLRFKHLGKRHQLTLKTFGISEQVNDFNSDGNKHGKWIENHSDGRLKKLQRYGDGILYEANEYHYYAAGNLRLKMDEINHLHTYYFETGEKNYEMRPQSRTDYYQTGIVKQVETEKQVSFYDQSGELDGTKEQRKSTVLNDYEMLMEVKYHPNGLIKMQSYANGKQFFYSENIDGCLAKMIDVKTDPFERIFTYENCELVAMTASYFNHSDGTGNDPFAISKGTFKNKRLITGTTEYYDRNTGKLRFIKELKNERATGVIWIDGVKYNDKNRNGQMQGMWVSNNQSWGVWQPGSSSDEILMKGYFEKGEQRDTIFHYYPGGEIKSISLKTLDRNIAANISYYISGNVSGKIYSFHEKYQSRVYKTLKYEDAQNGGLMSMIMNENYFTYKKEKISTRKSPKYTIDGSRALPHKNKWQYTSATGEFRKNHLYNGKIAYYNDYDELLKTVRVTSGKINGDRILIFKETALEIELTKSNPSIDTDHNGYITTSEAKAVEHMKIGGRWIESAEDFRYFYHLKTLLVNGWNVDPIHFKNEEELLKQIKLFAKKSRPSKRDPWDPGWIVEPDPGPPGPPEPPIIHDFVEVEPEFPGGAETMMKFIADNLKYPVGEPNQGGTVYVQFVVNDNGTIDQVNVVKGISQLFDQEAIRLIKSMPNWKPGQQAGKNVRVRFTLPIRFKLITEE